MRRQKRVGRNEIFIPARITSLVTAKRTSGPLEPPYSDLIGKMAIDLVYNVLVLDDQLERYHIASSVDTLIGTGATNEGGFLGVRGIGLGDGTCSNECAKQITFYSLVLVVNLHASIASARVADHNCHFALGPALLGLDLFCGEGSRQSGSLIFALLFVFGLLVFVASASI